MILGYAHRNYSEVLAVVLCHSHAGTAGVPEYKGRVVAGGRGCIGQELDALNPRRERPTVGFDGQNAAPPGSAPKELAAGKLGSRCLFSLGGRMQPMKRTISALATDGPSCCRHTKETV